MNIESVKSLFRQFSGEESEDNAPFIELAAGEVRRMLLPGADDSDVRLDFLAAAIANYRLSRIKASRDRTQVTYAGKMLKNGEGSPCESAAVLLKEHIQLCSELISAKTFIFAGYSGKEELC